MERDLSTFKTIIFDSDGVILDSNNAKLDSFKRLTSLVGSDKDIERIATIIRTEKGLTRYDIVGEIEKIARSRRGAKAPSYEWLLNKYSDMVYAKLLSCKVDQDIYKLRQRHPTASWFVLTAGDEDETKRLYHEIDIIHLFEGKIYGSPRTKSVNLQNILIDGSISDKEDVLMIGDSYSDAELAIEHEIPFVLITHWSNCLRAKQYCESFNLSSSLDVSDLMRLGSVNIPGRRAVDH